MAASATQPSDLGQDVDFALARRSVERRQRRERLTAQRLIESALLLALSNLDRHLGPRRQLAQHGALSSTQDERSDQRPQRIAGCGITALDRCSETTYESLARAEQAGIDGIEQAPQFLEIVLD